MCPLKILIRYRRAFFIILLTEIFYLYFSNKIVQFQLTHFKDKEAKEDNLTVD